MRRRKLVGTPVRVVTPGPAPAPQPVAPAVKLSPTQLATRALLRRAAESRKDISKFYEFTIRHETTKLPLKPAAHQRLMFKFVFDHEH
jgi:hypothetical protein